jgi:hypothetical protein
MKQKLTIKILIKEAQIFCVDQSKFRHKELFGVTDGKAVGTLIEQKFQKHLTDKYKVAIGSSASGIDLPSKDILTDIKVTSTNSHNLPALLRTLNKKSSDLAIICLYSFTTNQTTQRANRQC